MGRGRENATHRGCTCPEVRRSCPPLTSAVSVSDGGERSDGPRELGAAKRGVEEGVERRLGVWRRGRAVRG